MTVAAAALTSFYSWRLMFKTFHGAPHDRHHYEAAHESPIVMLVPLALLAIGSIGAGWPFMHLFTGDGAVEFFRDSLKIGIGQQGARGNGARFVRRQGHSYRDDGRRIARGLPVLYPPPGDPERLAREQSVLYHFLLNALVLRPELRLPLCSPDAVARPAPVEGRRRVHHRRVRPRRRCPPACST